MLEQAFDWTWGWIILGAIIAGLEILVPGMFLMWIGFGAVATGIVLARYPDLPVAWQMLVFAAAMLASLSIGFWIQRRSGRTMGARYLNRELQAMIGHTYVAITPFTIGHGRIKVQDSSFAAVSDETIAAGEMVEVVAIADGMPKVAKSSAPTGPASRRPG